MAISSVELLIDYREKVKNPIDGLDNRVTELEQGGSVDLGLIADNYNPNRNTYYPNNDMVVNDSKLYKSNTVIYPMIGEFDDEMWSEIPDYDSTVTYQGIQKVVHEGTPYSKNPMVPSVTGEWDSSYWIEITPTALTDYDATATTPPQALKIEDSFYQTNSDYEPTGGVGEFDSTKWTETTVEEVLSNIHTPVITKTSGMLCQATDITTDANGYVTNTLDSQGVNNVKYADYSQLDWSGMQAMGVTVYPVLERGFKSGSKDFRIKLLDGNGEPMKNVASGITDMGGIYYNAFNFTP